jgi:GNAT superfamily N-acetyltransferase
MLDPIARIRRFNRAVTREAGALDHSFLGRGRPLGVARVLWTLPQKGGDIAATRAELGLDSGLFSRILRQLEAEGLVTLARHAADGRRRSARLTPLGVAEVALYDDLNNTRAAAILAAAPRSETLLAAMDLIATTLNRDHVEIRRADPDEPAALACLAAYFALLADRIPGVTPATFPLPDPEAHKYRLPDGAFLIAWSDTMPLGCVSLRRLDAGLGEVKRLWVAPDARGQGLARRLMAAVEDQARRLGFTRLNLDTNAALTEAIALYQATGWTEIAPYSGFPSTHWFSKAL